MLKVWALDHSEMSYCSSDVHLGRQLQALLRWRFYAQVLVLSIGLSLTGFFLLSPGVDLDYGLYLVAPLGASAVLLFAVPNSPLAQPWSAIVGNTMAALVGVAVSLYVHEPALRIALAVGLAIAVTFVLRAVHPPAGAVAMTAAMSPDAVTHLGFWFALAPIAAGTASLVLIAIVDARLTGRHYPFRQFEPQNRHGPLSAAPAGLDDEVSWHSKAPEERRPVCWKKAIQGRAISFE